MLVKISTVTAGIHLGIWVASRIFLSSSCLHIISIDLSYILDVLLQCSVTCGEGQQLRLVECYNLTSQLKIQDQFCDAKSKPEELKVCKAITCPVWVTSKWSKVCNFNCGI